MFISSLSDQIVKILRNPIHAGALRLFRVFVALHLSGLSSSAQAQLAGRYYWHEDSYLRGDPSDEAPLQTWVPAGAYIEVQTCTQESWCFGKVYGVKDGWVPLVELHADPYVSNVEAGFLAPSAGKTERTYHLQDHRKFYGVLGTDFFLGTGSLKTPTLNLDRLQSWVLSVGVGRRLRSFNEYRWDAEFVMSHLSEWRENARVGGSSRIRSNDFSFGIGTKLLRPENEFFGYGGFLDLRFRFSGPSKDDGLEKRVPPFLVELGPVITHGSGGDKIKWFAWKFSFAFNTSEAMVGLGLNINF